jgi:hypothetical protein
MFGNDPGGFECARLRTRDEPAEIERQQNLGYGSCLAAAPIG